MSARCAVALLLVLLFVAALVLAAGCGKKESDEPAAKSDEAAEDEGYIEKGLKAPGEAHEAQDAAIEQLDSQDESVEDLEEQ